MGKQQYDADAEAREDDHKMCFMRVTEGVNEWFIAAIVVR